jgi:hypothetical protein
MKKSRLLFSLLIGTACASAVLALVDTSAVAGGLPFFMPKSELTPRYETLPPVVGQSVPVNRTAPAQSQTPQVQKKKKLKSYALVDGRYIPVYEEIEDTPNDSPETDDENDSANEQNAENMPEDVARQTDESQTAESNNETNAPIPLEEQAVPTADNKLPKPKTDSNAFAPKPKADDRPKYQQCYDQYAKDLKTFEKDKKMPENKELNRSLELLGKSRKEVLFEGKVKRKIDPYQQSKG